MTKPIDALKTIARYVEAKKPKTLAEAEHMLDVISVMADETILDEDAVESSLAKGLISKPFSHRSARPSPRWPLSVSCRGTRCLTPGRERG
jgi:predicted RNA-binding protein associated with RNAse of E/G family